MTADVRSVGRFDALLASLLVYPPLLPLAGESPPAVAKQMTTLAGRHRLLTALCAVGLSASVADCHRNVTFVGPWPGGDAWLVNYTGPYENDRPPHVQVGTDPDVIPRFACLTNLRAATSKAVEWDVVGVINKAANDVAHFTVYYGPDASSRVDEFR